MMTPEIIRRCGNENFFLALREIPSDTAADLIVHADTCERTCAEGECVCEPRVFHHAHDRRDCIIGEHGVLRT